MIKIKLFIINIYIKYKLLSTTPKIDVLKKGIKLFQNLLYILIIYIYIPEMLIHNHNDPNTNNANDNDKIIFMACFIFFSAVMSYVIQNYQIKPPGTPPPQLPQFSPFNESAYNIDTNSIGGYG